MGTFFLHDDYRVPDFNNLGSLPYKKDSSSGSSGYSSQQGLLDNNQCFANIKKGLGFGDDVSSSNGGNTNNNSGGESEWTYNRARSSPVVERLILQEIQTDIAESAITIGVAMDPKQWGVEDTRKWLCWVSDLYQIGDQTNCLSYDGQTLCGFSEQDFILLTGSEDAGLKIAAQLDLWEKATRMTPSASSYHFQQQQAMDQKLGSHTIGRQGTRKLLDVGCSWQAPPIQHYASTADILSSSNQLVIGGVGGVNNQLTNGNVNPNNQLVNGSNNSHASGHIGPNSHIGGNNVTVNTPPTYQDMRSSSFQPYNLLSSHLQYPTDHQVRSAPRPTIPLDRFRSVREACQDNGFLTFEKYQEFTNITPMRNTHNMMFPTSSNKGRNLPPSTVSYNETKETLPKIATKVEPSALSCSVKRESTSSDYKALNLSEVKTEKTENLNAEQSTEPTTSKTTEKALKKKSSKHPIHLWEFLKQLLHDGKDCIRWIDQEKGVFKIYNSQEVAKFWGERKNRPAMNYDKLSRSIRQYYKKGIIKKTSQGKRLVYQFCQGYL